MLFSPFEVASISKGLSAPQESSEPGTVDPKNCCTVSVPTGQILGICYGKLQSLYAMEKCSC